MRSKQANICFFNSTKFWGGGEKWHYEFASFLHNNGLNVIVASYNKSPLYNKAKASGLKVHNVSVSNLSFLNVFKILAVKRFFLKHQIKTLIINHPADLKLASFAAKKAGVEKIIYRRGSAIPIKNSLLNRYIFKNLVTNIIANSNETKLCINKHHHLFDEEKIEVIYNGIDINDFDKRESVPVYSRKKSSEIIFGNVGRMVHQKGQIMLLDIFNIILKKHPESKLIIAGEGKLENVLRSHASVLGISDSVIFTGFVEDVKSIMESIDVYLLSSYWEGFGYSIVEAMAAFKPVVAFDTNSNPEIIDDEKTGLLAPAYDTDIFASKAIELIENKSLMKTMGLAGRKKVENCFTLQKSADQLISFLMQ